MEQEIKPIEDIIDNYMKDLNLQGSRMLLSFLNGLLEDTKLTAAIFSDDSKKEDTLPKINTDITIYSALHRSQAAQLPVALPSPLTIEDCKKYKLPTSFANQIINYDTFKEAKLPDRDFVFMNSKIYKIMENREQVYINSVQKFIHTGDVKNKQMKYPIIFLADAIISLTNKLLTYKSLIIPSTLTKTNIEMVNFKSLLEHHNSVVKTYAQIKELLLLDKLSAISHNAKKSLMNNLIIEQQEYESFINEMFLNSKQARLAKNHLTELLINIHGGVTSDEFGKTTTLINLNTRLTQLNDTFNNQKFMDELKEISRLISITQSGLESLRSVSQSILQDAKSTASDIKDSKDIYSDIDKQCSQAIQELQNYKMMIVRMGLSRAKEMQPEEKQRELFMQLMVYQQNSNQTGVEALLKEIDIKNLTKQKIYPSFLKPVHLETLKSMNSPFAKQLYTHLMTLKCSMEIENIKKQNNEDIKQKEMFQKLIQYIGWKNDIGINLLLNDNLIKGFLKLKNRPDYITTSHLADLAKLEQAKELYHYLATLPETPRSTSTQTIQSIAAKSSIGGKSSSQQKENNNPNNSPKKP